MDGWQGGVMTRFGRSMLQHFALDPTVTYLNHGTVGAPPRRVLAAQQAIRDEIELQPSRYLLRELSEICVGAPRAEPPRLRTAAAEVAAFFGARGEDLVFVDNATTGANAVLRSVPLRGRDEILVTSLGYGAITNAARYVARQHGAVAPRGGDPAHDERPEEVVAAIDAALGAGHASSIIDHIASDSALLLPVAELAALLPGKARRAGLGGRRARAGADRPRHSVDRCRLVRRATCTSGPGRRAVRPFSGRAPSVRQCSIRR
jgi:isopenicillin-N epimerase